MSKIAQLAKFLLVTAMILAPGISAEGQESGEEEYTQSMQYTTQDTAQDTMQVTQYSALPAGCIHPTTKSDGSEQYTTTKSDGSEQYVCSSASDGSIQQICERSPDGSIVCVFVSPQVIPVILEASVPLAYAVSVSDGTEESLVQVLSQQSGAETEEDGNYDQPQDGGGGGGDTQDGGGGGGDTQDGGGGGGDTQGGGFGCSARA